MIVTAPDVDTGKEKQRINPDSEFCLHLAYIFIQMER